LIKTIFKCISLIISLVFYSVTHAEDELVVGIFNITPYGYLEKEELIGITPDIVTSLSKESGIKVNMRLIPYKRMLEQLKTGEIDFAIFFQSDFSRKVSHQLIPMYDLDTIAIGKKNTVIHEYKDLYKKSLVTPRGVRYSTRLESDKNIKITYVKNYKTSIQMLMLDRVDLIIAPEKILFHQLRLLGISRRDLGEKLVLTTNTAWIQFSNKSKKKKYIKRLKESAQFLKDKGVVKSIINKYYFH